MRNLLLTAILCLFGLASFGQSKSIDMESTSVDKVSTLRSGASEATSVSKDLPAPGPNDVNALRTDGTEKPTDAPATKELLDAPKSTTSDGLKPE